jgi:hypothetical protein
VSLAPKWAEQDEAQEMRLCEIFLILDSQEPFYEKIIKDQSSDLSVLSSRVPRLEEVDLLEMRHNKDACSEILPRRAVFLVLFCYISLTLFYHLLSILAGFPATVALVGTS